MVLRTPKAMRELESVLLENGYVRIRCRGSHFTYKNEELHKTITINKDLNRMVKQRLIKEYKLEV